MDFAQATLSGRPLINVVNRWSYVINHSGPFLWNKTHESDWQAAVMAIEDCDAKSIDCLAVHQAPQCRLSFDLISHTVRPTYEDDACCFMQILGDEK